MSSRRRVRRIVQTIGLVVFAGLSGSAEAGLFGFGGDSWQEEVLLHDGGKVVVERRVERGGRHEVGQEPSYKEQSLRFTLPGTNQMITWEDHYSDDLDQANFLPIALDIVAGTSYLVVYPMGCLSYNKWGRPNPPYVVFQYRENEWTRIPLGQLPTEITSPNVLFSQPDVEVERFGNRVITADMIKGVIAGYKQAEFRTLLREPVKEHGQSQCGEMVDTGKGRWIGLGWFKRQVSLSACEKYCEKRNVPKERCPCATLFKEKGE